MNATKPTKKEEIKREWHHVDVSNKVLGRVSTEIVKLLMGKSKPYFIKNLDCGDYVVVTNAKKIKVTGRKEEKKVYHRHSGYPGGFKSETLKELRQRRPEDILLHAVKGMLPQNKLRATMLKRLYIVAGDTHQYGDKFASK